MKIVVLNGSPRKNGNTSGLVNAFAEGARSAGHTVTVFHLDSMDLHGCKGCLQGHRCSPEKPCVQRDDMDLIYPPYKVAELVVFASPLYYWNFSAQLRTAQDRLYAVEEACGRPKKQAVLLMAAQGRAFEDSVQMYRSMLSHLGWTDRGMVLCGKVHRLGDITGRPELEEAYKLGASL